MSERIKIGIIAAPGAGASSLLGAIAGSVRHDRPDALHVHGLDEESVEYLQSAAETVRVRGEFQNQPLWKRVRFHAHSDAFDADFEVLDADGSQVALALRSLDDGRLDPIIEHLVACDVLWIVLDPAVDLDESSEPKTDQRLVALKTLLAERRKRAARIDDSQVPDIAVVLTKADLHPKLRTKRQARELAVRNRRGFMERLKQFGGRIEFFATSAYGREGAPQGVEELLAWTAASVRRRRFRSRRILFAGIAFLVLFGAAAFGATRFVGGVRELAVVENESLSKTERLLQTTGESERVELARQQLFRERLEELQSELAGAIGDDRLREVDRELDRLERAAPGRSAARIAELRRAALRRREDRLLAEIRDAAERQRGDLEDLIKKYLGDFPNSDRRVEIDKLREGYLDRELNAARMAVRLTSAVDASSLERKADAIRDFLNRFGPRLDEVERQTMRRAAELGARFARPATYRVRLKRSGNLVSPRVQHVKVIIDGNPVKEFIAPAATTTAIWGKTFDVSWQAGGGVSALLVSQSKNWVNSNYYVVAERGEEGLFALRVLTDPAALQVREAWRGVFNRGEGYLDFEIEGLSNDDWRIASEYLSPGEKW